MAGRRPVPRSRSNGDENTERNRREGNERREGILDEDDGRYTLQERLAGRLEEKIARLEKEMQDLRRPQKRQQSQEKRRQEPRMIRRGGYTRGIDNREFDDDSGDGDREGENGRSWSMSPDGRSILAARDREDDGREHDQNRVDGRRQEPYIRDNRNCSNGEEERSRGDGRQEHNRSHFRSDRGEERPVRYRGRRVRFAESPNRRRENDDPSQSPMPERSRRVRFAETPIHRREKNGRSRSPTADRKPSQAYRTRDNEVDDNDDYVDTRRDSITARGRTSMQSRSAIPLEQRITRPTDNGAPRRSIPHEQRIAGPAEDAPRRTHRPGCYGRGHAAEVCIFGVRLS